MHRGTWWAGVHGVSKSQTQLSTHTPAKKRGGQGEEAGRGEHRRGPSEVGPAEQLVGQKRGRAVMLKSRAGWASEGAGKRDKGVRKAASPQRAKGTQKPPAGTAPREQLADLAALYTGPWNRPKADLTVSKVPEPMAPRLRSMENHVC